jgi:hypothetical protein
VFDFGRAVRNDYISKMVAEKEYWLVEEHTIPSKTERWSRLPPRHFMPEVVRCPEWPDGDQFWEAAEE